MDSTTALREFLGFVISQLIDHPDEATITHRMDRKKHVFEVELAETDIGRVIGKNGQTVGAIRNLLDAAAYRNKERVSLNINRRTQEQE